MKTIVESIRSGNSRSNKLIRQEGGLTLIEVLVVIVVIVTLASLLLLAAPFRNRGSADREVCLNNLRQIGLLAMAYAEDFQGWLPPWRAGQPGMNDMSEERYSRYVWTGKSRWRVEDSWDQKGNGSFQNIGLCVFKARDWKTYFCPALSKGAYSEKDYTPLLTSDSRAEDGYEGGVRSSYHFNPRIINADPAKGPVDTHRRFVKLSPIKMHKVFVSDMIPAKAHARDKGFNVLYSDGSVSFNKNTNVWGLVSKGLWTSALDRETIFDLWEKP